MKPKDTYQSVREVIEKTGLIDAHCHIIPFDDLSGRMDLFRLFALYNAYSLVSAGMSMEDHQKLEGTDLAVEEKWRIFKPFWEKIGNTACAKVFLKAMRELHGIDTIDERTYKDLSGQVAASYSTQNTDWYEHVLKKAAGIDLGILDYGTPKVDRRFFVPVYRFENRRAPAYDHFITIRTRDELETIEQWYNRDLVSFDDFLSLYEEAFSLRVKEGIVGIKLLLAYLRTLDFQLVTKNEAEKVFNSLFMRFKPNPRFLQHQMEGPSWSETKILQDYMVHQTLRHAMNHKLVVQIHAGFQAGRRNRISFADPKLLNPLFVQYRNLKFVVMHMALPFTYDLAIMAKNFNNVAIDFSWAQQLSPSIAARVLNELLELLPAGKILGFGSDNAIAEGALGEAITSRDVIYRVLSGKIDEGYFTEEESLEIARGLLRENAVEYFNLSV